MSIQMATISIKVVAGARSDRVVGRYGEMIKIQVSSAPEKGRANEAVVELIARVLNVRPAQVRITRGHTTPRKTVEVEGMPQAIADAILAGSTG
jgi:hypothetical protein